VSIDPHEAEAIRQEVLVANTAFYAAFEEGSMPRISSLWSHADDVICTHPGWPTLRGWTDVRRSWEGILRGGGAPQFIITEERAVVHGIAAWVTCVENMLGPEGPAGTAAALNVFVLHDHERWLLVAHHSSIVNGVLLN
jgi:ketosteroid isomerase-like protein